MPDEERQLQEIFRHFQICGEILHIQASRIGHIHETYVATYGRGGTLLRCLHQKINQNVFKDPPALMNNLLRVTTHLRGKLEAQHAKDLTRRCLIVIPTRDGQFCYRHGDGEFWRTFAFIEGARTFQTVQSPRQAFQAGKAFGEFQHLLSDLPGRRLVETIPDFHNTRNRFIALRQAIQNDHYNRAKSAKVEIEFAFKREPIVDVILKGMAKGEIPERITHNDTKLNNVMFDIKTGKALCVVDLDTVMPGCVLSDFGDMVRTTTTPSLEDERDLSRVKLHMANFKKLAEGYLSAAGSFLTKAEKSCLALSAKLITFEVGIRFLTDYLSGDTYFRIHRPRHNLDRARTQFRLLESIERQEQAMQKFIDSL